AGAGNLKVAAAAPAAVPAINLRREILRDIMLLPLCPVPGLMFYRPYSHSMRTVKITHMTFRRAPPRRIIFYTSSAKLFHDVKASHAAPMRPRPAMGRTQQ